MAEADDDAPIEIHTLRGDLTVGPSDDGQFAIFTYSTFEGPMQLAVPVGRLGELIAAVAHAYSPEMPEPGSTKQMRALRTTGWSILRAASNSIAFSFSLAPGSCLTFLVPQSETEGLPEALAAALPFV
jgi:hypothetical protein